MSQDSSKMAFFRQSGWLVLCTVLSGMVFYGVHFFAKVIPEPEYAVFGTLLAVLNCLSIPALGLQMVFTQQTAAAVSADSQRSLARAVHGALAGCFVIWLVAILVVFGFRERIVSGWNMSNEAALWLMLVVALASLWLPVFTGLLQGRQNFLWMGWAMILNSVGRFAVVALIVVVLHGYAAGMTAGILIGILATLGVSAWASRESWRVRGAPMNWREWLSRVVPLTLGFGAFQFMFGADPLFVQWHFNPECNASYIMSGTMGRALCSFTVPVVAVMFPKIVRSAALSEKSNVLGLTFMVTGVLVGIGALGLAVVAPWVLPLVGKPEFAEAAPLLRWFALSMTPLAIANVILNDLLARNRFKVIPWLVVIAVAYGFALSQFQPATKAFTAEDFKSLPSLAAQLRQATNPVAAFVSGRLSPDTARQVSEFRGASNHAALASALATDFNRLCAGDSLYETNRFATVKLPEHIQARIDTHPQGEEQVRLNRILLQSAFPKSLSDSAYARIIQTLGGFSVLFLIVVALFRWRDGRAA
jgi:O-antigen/teichoic acid export membrane protein